MDSLQVVSPPLCSRCGAPFASRTGFSHLCAKCIANPSPIDWSRSLFVYEDPVAALIKGLKYKRDRSCLKALLYISRPLIHKVFEDAPVDIHSHQLKKEICVIPVPLHNKRLRDRLFNQALLIARGLFPAFAVNTRAVKRAFNNPPQSTLSRLERMKNVKGIFEADQPGHFPYYLLVDDVMTTGSTLNEIAKVLKDNGAINVLSLTLARSVR